MTDANLGVTSRTFSVLVSSAVTLPFADAFDRADSTLFLGPYWTVNTGTITLKNNKANFGAGLSIASLNHSTALGRDLALQADVNIGLNQNLGLIARYNGGLNNFYWGAIVNNNGVFTARIYKNVNGIQTQLATAPVNFGVGTLRFEVADVSLKLFYGANAASMTLVAFANDAALTNAGGAGIRSSSGNVTLVNFTANAINLTTPMLSPAFVEEFDTTSNTNQLSRNWTERQGNFNIIDDGGNKRLVGNSASASIATVHGLLLADATIEAKLILGANQHAALLARYQANGSYYMAMVQANAAGTAFTPTIYKVVGGVLTKVNGAILTPITTGSGKLRFVLAGTSLKLFYSPLPGGAEVLVTSGFDAAIRTEGLTGVRASKGAVLDDFAVSP